MNTQYGPYSPQEVDRVSQWLQQQNIQFEILRNDQEAREALMNDGQNLVNLADLRTGIYLAQIFYISLKDATDIQTKNFEKMHTPQSENFPRERSAESSNDEALVHSSSLKNKVKKRSWSWFLAIVSIAQVLIAFYYIIFKGV